MSGMFMMARQSPDDGSEPIVTTMVPGLDKLRRQTQRQMMFASAITVLACAAFVGVAWGRLTWWEIAIMVVLILIVFVGALVAGAFLGRHATFKDLSRATVNVSHVMLEDPDGPAQD